MSSESFKYFLRFAIQPGYYEEKRYAALVDFCRQAKIDDVTFFVDCEELNTGHVTRDELKPWLDMILRFKERLSELGITTSLNPWTTLVHGDRGRKLKSGQDFHLMTDMYGKTAHVQACPICPEWRKYIGEIYSEYATIKPYIIWVEDDFRFHNHPPLHWGGCFCDLHMAEYSRRLGHKVSREEFVKGILKPEEIHPFRKIWLDCCRETTLENAKIIGDAVHSVSPHTLVGLMSSKPEVHCAEARDWHTLLNNFSGGGEMVIRPHLPAYTEIAPQDYLWNFAEVSLLTQAMIPVETTVYPELDNGPHLRYSVSKVFTRLKLLSSLFLGSKGVTLNIFDMIGSGVLPGEGYQNVLGYYKDFMTAVTRLKLGSLGQNGVKVLYSPLSSYSIMTSEGENIDELYPQEWIWASMLSIFGVPSVFTDDINQRNQVVAVSGQYFRNFERQQLEVLFKNNFVIMDGEAAYTLFDIGCGALAGIKNATWHPYDSGFQTFEEICNGKVYAGIEGARISSQINCGDYVELDYIDEPYYITKQKNPRNEVVGAGQIILNNSLFIFPYGRYKGKFKAHQNPIQQAIIQQVIIDEIRGRNIFLIRNDPGIMLEVFKERSSTILLAGNFTNDRIDRLTLHAPGIDCENIMAMGWNNPEVQIKVPAVLNGDDLILEAGLEAGEVKILFIEEMTL